MDPKADIIYKRVMATCEANVKEKFLIGVHANDYRLAFLDGVASALEEFKKEVL